MSDETTDAMSRIAAYGAASGTLNRWIEGAQALALLAAALSSGIFEAARTPRTPAQIGARIGVDAARVADFCLALDAHGVLDCVDGAYRMSPDFATLAAADAPNSLPAVLASASAVARLLSQVTSPETGHPALTPEEMLAVARGVTLRPGAPLALELLTSLFATLPELTGVWERGARHVELGCGISGAVLNALLLYPRLTAVGVDREAALLEEARASAALLGLADRVTFRQLDARDLDDENAFETAFWSQFFFPAESRSAALGAAWRALKPGGLLCMPLLSPPPEPGALREEGGRRYARARVLYGGWGIPAVTPQELRAETEAAGFVYLRESATAAARVLVMRRPDA